MFLKIHEAVRYELHTLALICYMKVLNGLDHNYGPSKQKKERKKRTMGHAICIFKMY